MAYKYFDVAAILGELANKIDILPQEVFALHKRINALAVGSKPPAWGYAGMLLTLAEAGDINNIYDVYAHVAEWRADHAMAFEFFTIWNNARMAAR